MFSILIKSILTALLVYSLCFLCPEQSLPGPRSQKFSAVFFYKVFSSTFSIRPMTLFVYCCTFSKLWVEAWVVTLGWFSRMPNYSSTIYWKDYPFPIELPRQLCWKSIDHLCVGLDPLLSHCPVHLSFRHLVYHSSAASIEVGYYQPPNLLFFKISLAFTDKFLN